MGCAVAFAVAGRLLIRNDSFHRDFPTRNIRLTIVDEDGGPISHASAVVTTTYWYPTFFGTAKSTEYRDTFAGDAFGQMTVEARQHHQATRISLAITAHGRLPFETRIDDSTVWSESVTHSRRVALASARLKPTRKLYMSDSMKESRVAWEGRPLYLSFATGEISQSSGDLVFEIDRPPADHPRKLDQPLRCRISYPAGQLQPMTSHEEFALPGPLSRWGDRASVERTTPNSRHSPSFSESILFCSRDGAQRGALTIYCTPVIERDADPALMSISVRGRIEFYPPDESPAK